jgi:Fic-DOC domain mobile mystery protein B
VGCGGAIARDVGLGLGAAEPEGNTPLDPDEAADLIPTHLATRAQLNAWEQANIALAVLGRRRRRTTATVLDVVFLCDLHRRMFGRTWRWAGRFRRTGKNIGVPAEQIAESLRNLLADTQYWITHETYPVDEIAARFHHRLVSVHLFPNGNGRHARLVTDLLLESLRAPRFSWGSGSLDDVGDVRSRYLQALRRADVGSFGELMEFVRS